MMNTVILRPSAASKWVRCSGYIAMAQQFPEPEGTVNIVRDEGTAFHAVLHMMSANVSSVKDGDVVEGVCVDEYMIECSHEALDYLRSLNAHIYHELTMRCDYIHPNCGGTADAVGVNISQRVIYIFDAKYGYRKVDSYENYQLTCYLAGAIQYFGLQPDRLLAEGWKACFVIYQPRTQSSGSGRFDRYVFPLADFFQRLLPVLRTAAVAALSPPEQRSLCAGQHCYKCSAAAHCPALRHDALSALDYVSAYSTQTVNAAQLAHELDLLERAQNVIKVRLESLEIEAADRIKSGEVVPGYDFKPSAGRIRWKESHAAKVVGIAETLGLGSIAQPAKPMGVRAAEKIVGPEFIAQYTESPAGKARLVKVKKADAAKAFGE